MSTAMIASFPSEMFFFSKEKRVKNLRCEKKKKPIHLSTSFREPLDDLRALFARLS